jgi:type IV secretory pathway VirB2 component (pilin)
MIALKLKHRVSLPSTGKTRLLSAVGSSARNTQAAVLHQSLLLALTLVLALTALNALASSTGTVTPMGNVVCAIVSWAMGNLGRGIAVLAVCVLGVGAMLGKVSWGLSVVVGVGIAVFFGACWIVTYLAFQQPQSVAQFLGNSCM